MQFRNLTTQLNDLSCSWYEHSMGYFTLGILNISSLLFYSTVEWKRNWKSLTVLPFQDVEPDAAWYLMNQVRKFICRDGDLFMLGIQLGMPDSTIERIRTDHQGNMLMKGWKLASKFYTDTVGTKEFKLDKFHTALIDIGKAYAKSFEEYSSNEKKICMYATEVWNYKIIEMLAHSAHLHFLICLTFWTNMHKFKVFLNHRSACVL